MHITFKKRINKLSPGAIITVKNHIFGVNLYFCFKNKDEDFWNIVPMNGVVNPNNTFQGTEEKCLEWLNEFAKLEYEIIPSNNVSITLLAEKDYKKNSHGEW